MDTLVSIIIPHWNGIDILSECIDSLNNTEYSNFEIIVVDNYSSDESVKWLKANHPKIKIIENDKNYGYAGGCNRGINNSKGDYIVFLNNDTIHKKDWLSNLVTFMNKRPDCAAVQPKILNYYERDKFDYAGGAGGHMDILCYPFARGRLFLEQEIDNNQYDDDAPCFWASGTAIMVRKEFFLEVEKFDENFFAHMEEIDLCWRLQLKGHNIYVNPKSVIYHKNAVSLPMTSIKKFMLNHRNSLMMLLSNYKVLTTLYLFPIRYMLELVAILYALTKLDFRHMFGVIQAHLWILFHIHIIFYKRIKINRLRTIGDYEIMKSMYKGSIIWDHYIRRMKTYRDIFFSTSS
ncbi:MAG: glycosyltransferase family 2 protein [Candidatus Neomarinimicrobiota bacterium]|jgi:GT2 family glycosyltransferase|nr:glycosyltransferase family 2 protein [Candidatus Neomarinimicrobiota bacterium]MED5266701.1 glycosyltransferase family 2 protein [Candidatus Neomarinimicrobiota bacterium]|tara:strand:+ start:7005 stop:8048 length:1044 start_codon:yes stop_codon:yes gene_type:complete